MEEFVKYTNTILQLYVMEVLYYSYNNKYDFQSPPQEEPFINKRNQYYLPRVTGENKLLTDKELILLWEILPYEFTILDMKLIYRGDTDGY
ncbi:MAG: hypothetical protein J6P07_08955, partial [Spirochaetaceae bacterium]|nr:hypothetical protein [Spirochaetaceae bacterium]